ncbi:hypothetical protein AVEN_26566-1 [Araneus ventricosus]|uniref:Uncharacterized protein n=1 Tax=Araneus ventricosus TaxID=182803 RepID=A0A4Y2FQD4_ARAVE|nr:hypothetical protein AVEN_26566-1 [Araneus ventricosus]
MLQVRPGRRKLQLCHWSYRVVTHKHHQNYAYPKSGLQNLRVGQAYGKASFSKENMRVPVMTTRPTAFSPLSEQQSAEIRPTSIEAARPVTDGLGVRGLKQVFKALAV